jgi:hypothetical protein
MGEIGFGVDNIISLRVVTSSGSTLTVDESSNPDLFWARFVAQDQTSALLCPQP